MKPFRRINTSDRVLETIQSNTGDAISSIHSAPELNGRYVDATVAATVDNIIKHSLGKPYQYFEVMSRDANVTVWLSPTVNNAKDQQIILKANAAAHITIRLT
jgi:hypothetical protein